MTNPTSNYSFQMPTSTDLVTDLPADFEVFGQAVDTRLKALQPGTTLGDLAYSSATANTNTRLAIGTTGQVLTVAGGVPTWASGSPGDIEGVTAGVGISGGGTSGTVTVTNSMATAIDAKGDLIGGTGADTFSRLAVGANNTVLTADSAAATGMKWATPAGAKSFTELSSASVGTGTTYTVSGLSGYDILFFQFTNVSCNGAGAITFRFNGDSTAGNYLYNGLGFYQSGSSAVSLQEIVSSNTLISVASPNAAALDASGGLMLFGANTSGVKIFDSLGASSSTGVTNYTLNGVYKGTSVISSVTLGGDGNNFDAGTLTIWGAA